MGAFPPASRSGAWQQQFEISGHGESVSPRETQALRNQGCFSPPRQHSTALPRTEAGRAGASAAGADSLFN